MDTDPLSNPPPLPIHARTIAAAEASGGTEGRASRAAGSISSSAAPVATAATSARANRREGPACTTGFFLFWVGGGVSSIWLAVGGGVWLCGGLG